MLKLESGCSLVETDGKNESREALTKIHEELNDMKRADSTVAYEMNKLRVVCNAPPITPRCHVEEEPASPLLVSEAMYGMQSSRDDLQRELDALRPYSAGLAKRFQQDLVKMTEQAQDLNLEIGKLSALTSFKQISDRDYDKVKILDETHKIEKLLKVLEKTRKQAEKDID